MYTITRICLLTFLFITTSVFAATPELINYQGFLKDFNNQPLPAAAMPMTFSIYDVANGGTQLWTEFHPLVPIKDGIFSVVLGSFNPISDTIFVGTSRYLEIILDDNLITPRTRFVSTPYSLRVQSIDQAKGGFINGGLEISPNFDAEKFGSVGKAISVVNDIGDPQMTFTVSTIDGATFTIVEPEDSKSGRSAGSPTIEINKDGIVMYGIISSDTTLTLSPNGNIHSVGQIAVGSDVSVGAEQPTAKLDVNSLTGFNQIRMRTSFTPSSSSDTSGNVGDIAWDDNFIYIKTSTGWKRTSLTTF